MRGVGAALTLDKSRAVHELPAGHVRSRHSGRDRRTGRRMIAEGRQVFMPGLEDLFAASGNRESIPTFAIWAGDSENRTTFELSLDTAI